VPYFFLVGNIRASGRAILYSQRLERLGRELLRASWYLKAENGVS
jgi:hypothetical protein